ncbi:MAG: radical SAM protein [Candidatus Omnitrophica bacterium]|nr:radical SAM protein [Candidatus Omnitrophota bacterium]
MKITVVVPPSKYSRNVARDLIWGCWCKGKRIAGTQFDPVSQLIVVTLLKEEGHEARLLDAAGLQMGVEEAQGRMAGDDIAIVLTNTVTVNEDAQFLAGIKRVNPKLKTIVYGNHPTFYPQDTAAKDGMDFCVHKEAEWVIRDLVRALDRGEDPGAVKGITFRRDGRFVTTEPYPYIRNLDELPVPDRSQLPQGITYFNPIVKFMPFTTMTTTRGCPAKCNYCSAPPFYGRIYRAQSPQRVVDEMAQIEKMGYREVFFRDEVFNYKRTRVMEICKLLIQNRIRLSWIVSSRVDTVDKEMLEAMKEAGCHMLRFGVESGDQGILDNIEKGATLEQARQAFQWIHETGLEAHCHAMMGMPGETRETLEKTIRFILELEPTTMTCGICTPYPGTPLFDRVLQTNPDIGDGSQKDLASLHMQGFHNDVFTEVPQVELARGIRRLYRNFYLRPSYIWRTFKRLKSFDELRRVVMAAGHVFGFSVLGEE